MIEFSIRQIRPRQDAKLGMMAKSELEKFEKAFKNRSSASTKLFYTHDSGTLVIVWCRGDKLQKIYACGFFDAWNDKEELKGDCK